MQGEKAVVAERTQLERLMEMPREDQIDTAGSPARDRLRGPPGRVLALDPVGPDDVVMCDDDAEELRRRFCEQGVDLRQAPAADAAALERERLRRVHPHDQQLRVAKDRLELASEMPPPGAERREQPLPDAVERYVVVARYRQHRSDPGQLVGERPRLAELNRLRPQREIARDHHQIRPAHGGELQHTRRNRRQMLGPEVNVGDVQNVAQEKASKQTLAYRAKSAVEHGGVAAPGGRGSSTAGSEMGGEGPTSDRGAQDPARRETPRRARSASGSDRLSIDKGQQMLSVNGLVLAALVGLVAVSAASTKATSGSETWVVRPGTGVGPILLGASPAEVRKILQAPDQIHERTYVYESSLKISFREDDSVRAIYLTSGPDFAKPVPFAARTAEGIGFGSTRAEVDAWLGTGMRVIPNAGARGVEIVEPAAGGILVTLFDGKVVELIVVPGRAETIAKP